VFVYRNTTRAKAARVYIQRNHIWNSFSVFHILLTTTNQILYFIFEQSDWSMKQEVRNFLRNLSNCWGIVQRCSFKLGNELVNIFRNASIGTTVRVLSNELKTTFLFSMSFNIRLIMLSTVILFRQHISVCSVEVAVQIPENLLKKRLIKEDWNSKQTKKTTSKDWLSWRDIFSVS
jgi:hypothetical protein